MSRRRIPRREAPGTRRFTVECDGRETHSVERIARVKLVPRPDLPELDGYAVRVEYVRVDQDPEESDYTMPLRQTAAGPHMTRRFVCSTCNRDRPMRDTEVIRLGLVLHTLGVSRVRLREVPAILTRE